MPIQQTLISIENNGIKLSSNTLISIRTTTGNLIEVDNLLEIVFDVALGISIENIKVAMKVDA